MQTVHSLHFQQGDIFSSKAQPDTVHLPDGSLQTIPSHFPFCELLVEPFSSIFPDESSMVLRASAAVTRHVRAKPGFPFVIYSDSYYSTQQLVQFDEFYQGCGKM